jgi:branched-chain amino acid transport system ATP-binding protein
LNGKPLHRANARDRARHGLALVPEGRRNLFPPLTVYENLQLGLRLLPKGDRAAMLQSLLDLFPILGPRRMQVAGLLSGGEQQMLALAVSLARRPSVLLLDEPSQGLAPMLLENLAQQIIAMRGLGVSVLLAEQNHRFAAQLCDRYVVLSSGELTGGGTREDLQNTNNVTAALMV